MFASLAHLAVAAILAALTVAAVLVWRRDRSSCTLIVIAVGLGLVYDNAMLGIGRWLGHGDALEALSVPRFVIHALVTPLLVIVAYGVARRFGLGAFQSRAGHAWACVAATALVAWGVVIDVIRLELDAETEAGLVSYANANAVFPLNAVVPIVALLVVGGLVWRSSGWAWLTVGAAVMLVASGLSGLLTNIGELALVASLVATENTLRRRGDARSGDVPAHAHRGSVGAPPAR